VVISKDPHLIFTSFDCSARSVGDIFLEAFLFLASKTLHSLGYSLGVPFAGFSSFLSPLNVGGPHSSVLGSPPYFLFFVVLAQGLLLYC
jgi:hypothetical protein